MDGLSWFDTQNESLPSLLTQAGYDVYLSNDRGTKNCMRHSTIDPVASPKEFFDYSYAEIGEYDIPANLNYVKQHIRQGGMTVTYIGFAQGATALLYGASKPDKAMYLT